MDEEKAKVAVTGSAHYAVARTTPYTRGAPCPPSIRVPNPNVPVRVNGAPAKVELLPSPNDVDPSLVTAEELEVIARISPDLSAEMDPNWTYESRRKAQRIIDYLYLGANVAIRDLSFLEREGITMIVVARDSRMMTWNKRSCDLAEEKLGLKIEHIDVNSPHQLITGFPRAIRAINEHLLSFRRRKADDAFKHAKILVTCETGNDRSAAIVAAYIMAVFGCRLPSVLHFITIQRFCCTFDEDLKRMLNNWEDLVRARATVARGQARDPSPYPKTKRGFDDTMDLDSPSTNEGMVSDENRFEGRNGFVPFRDMLDDHLTP